MGREEYEQDVEKHIAGCRQAKKMVAVYCPARSNWLISNNRKTIPTFWLEY